jgi:hypothetical protein
VFTFLLIFTISACGPTDIEIQATVQASIAQTQVAISQTQAAIPTATQVPFSALNLESMLIINGDLPAGYEASQVRSKLSDLSKSAPTPEYFISQSLTHNGNYGGGIDVLVYDDASKAQTAYRVIDNNVPGDLKNIEIGEGGQVASTSFIVSTVSLLFVRCHAAVSIQFMETTQEDDAISYAKRLDERLKPIVCR